MKFKNLIFFLLIFSFIFIFSNKPTLAADVCENAELTIIARDSNNDYIGDISYRVYEQASDADGKPKPGKLKASGKIDPVLGLGKETISHPDGIYTLKLWDKNNDAGAFYFYNDISLSCGSAVVITEKLSAIKFILRDQHGDLIKNKKILLYSQREDIDGDPIKEKDDLIGSANTTEVGEAIFYVSSEERSLNGDSSNYYIFEAQDNKGLSHYKYDIKVSNEKTKTVKYTFANINNEDATLNIIVRDSNNNLLKGMHYEIYKQAYDADGKAKPGDKIASGITDKVTGLNKINIKDPNGLYVVKIWKHNDSVRPFYFYNAVNLNDGDEKTFTAMLSAIKFILRDSDKELAKNTEFSLYSQRIDTDGNPIREKEDFISLFNTSMEGEVIAYVPTGQKNINPEFNNYYIFESNIDSGRKYIKYDIKVNDYKTAVMEYFFSNAILTFKKANGEILRDKTINFYEQVFDSSNNKMLGTKVKSKKTDEHGMASFRFPQGIYAITVEDDIRKNNIYWNISIEDNKRLEKTININYTELGVKTKSEIPLKERTKINIYKLDKNASGGYTKGIKLGSIKLKEDGKARLSLSEGAYLFVVDYEKIEYGKAHYIENGLYQKINIDLNENNEIKIGKSYNPKKNNLGTSLSKKLKGYILLQTESRGEAWYVDMKEKRRYYMKDGYSAHNIMRKMGLGISNADLAAIPIGQNKNFVTTDSDNDGLSDKTEEALKTDPLNPDSDNDGYSDGLEIQGGYNPLGTGKLNWNQSRGDKLKGQILLQVESRGEAWYVNPKDGKRYYMQDGNSAYQIMRFLSLGITNANLEKIEKGIILN